MSARLLRRLSGREDDALDDLRRLLAIRRGWTPARPDLGLPDLPPWRSGPDGRRELQEAIAASIRGGDPRLIAVAVQATEGEEARFVVQARRGEQALAAGVRPDRAGGVEVAR